MHRYPHPLSLSPPDSLSCLTDDDAVPNDVDVVVVAVFVVFVAFVAVVVGLG